VNLRRYLATDGRFGRLPDDYAILELALLMKRSPSEIEHTWSARDVTRLLMLIQAKREAELMRDGG
jgi:hypothetical protein